MPARDVSLPHRPPRVILRAVAGSTPAGPQRPPEGRRPATPLRRAQPRRRPRPARHRTFHPPL